MRGLTVREHVVSEDDGIRPGVLSYIWLKALHSQYWKTWSICLAKTSRTITSW
jgi:hypothetical protein